MCLAAGLDKDNYLSAATMQRGWQCLKLFSKQLKNIPSERIRVVATAALRIAENAQDFLQTAEHILGYPVNVISGEEEASLIYQGVAHTTGGSDKRLVVDIGGGSTELVTGKGTHATKFLVYQWAVSLGVNASSVIIIYQIKIFLKPN